MIHVNHIAHTTKQKKQGATVRTQNPEVLFTILNN